MNSYTYNSWYNMIQRCSNQKHVSYNNYGRKGISVCKQWLDKDNFIKDMGERPLDKTLDRIDNSKGYYKDNCKWSTKSEQNLSKNPCGLLKEKYISYNGYSYTVSIPIIGERRNRYIGSYNSIQKALQHRDNYIKENNLCPIR